MTGSSAIIWFTQRGDLSLQRECNLPRSGYRLPQLRLPQAGRQAAARHPLKLKGPEAGLADPGDVFISLSGKNRQRECSHPPTCAKVGSVQVEKLQPGSPQERLVRGAPESPGPRVPCSHKEQTGWQSSVGALSPYSHADLRPRGGRQPCRQKNRKAPTDLCESSLFSCLWLSSQHQHFVIFFGRIYPRRAAC